MVSKVPVCGWLTLWLGGRAEAEHHGTRQRTGDKSLPHDRMQKERERVEVPDPLQGHTPIT